MIPVIDIHIHIQPLHMFKPQALELVKRGRRDFADVERYSADPKAFLQFLDTLGVERAGLINYVSPEVIGFPPEVFPLAVLRPLSGSGSLAANVASLEAADEVVFYCHHGMRSLDAAAWLRGQGVEGAKSMAGGIERWSREVDPQVPRY